MASGVVSTEHPLYVGTFTGGAIEQACVGEADLIVLIGLDPVELIRKPWTYRASVLDISEIARQPHYLKPEQRMLGPLPYALSVLISEEAAASPQSTWTSQRIAAHRESILAGLQIETMDELSSSAVVSVAADAFQGRPRLSVDAGAHMFSACAFWPARQARDILISNGLATMGFAIPAGIAAALHDPTRGALAMTGDGGALMCLGELKTAVQVDAKLCIIVFNDGRLSLIDIKREERQMPDLGLSWQCVDFAAIAAGFGFRTWQATTIEQFAAACYDAYRYNGPSLIDVRIGSSGYLEQMKALRG